jgi:hypothetical protein
MAASTTGDRIPAAAATLLTALLKGDEPVHRALRAQIPHLRITGRCTCSCASIDLGLDRTAVAGAPVDEAIVADATVLDPDGEPMGGALVFAFDGYLSHLEVYAWEDEQITELPSPDRLS